MSDAIDDVSELIELVSEKPSASPPHVQSGPLSHPPFRNRFGDDDEDELDEDSKPRMDFKSTFLCSR
jgi:hypothetical protein